MKNALTLSLVLSLMLATSAAFAATITITITPGTNATSHRIEKKVGAGSYAALTTITMPTASFIDSAVSVGNNYTYRAISINAMGESAPSAECFSALLSAGPPSVNCSVQP